MQTDKTTLPSLIALLFLLFGSCKQTVYNGFYCAQVNYYNGNTDKYSEYTLFALVENNALKEIKFPTGFLNKEHFGRVMVSPDGKASFELEGRKEYKILITGDVENCLTNVANAVQCKGRTKSGRRCKNMTDNHGGFCHHHYK